MADELSAALHELAADQETAPVVGGPATRARAVRRRRRRRAAAGVGTGTAALALLGVALTLIPGGTPDRHPAAHRPSTPASPTPSTPDRLDLSRHTLTFDGRVMPILSASDALLDAANPMTVVTKADPREMRLDVSPTDPPIGPTSVRVRYVVELRDGTGRPHQVGLTSPQLKALSADDAKGGWIGLGAADSKWFYTRVHPGDTLSLTTAPTQTATPSPMTSPPR
ncbi:hypothetical protein ACIQVT_30010 [Streptomyces sp. NPDC100445]|uniref:hypothetical protein n=1 Tax=Streptomyces sp. NPDC100445 TaxID=3366102 RepID=UPI003820BA55